MDLYQGKKYIIDVMSTTRVAAGSGVKLDLDVYFQYGTEAPIKWMPVPKTSANTEASLHIKRLP
jgi:hypothetical protein